MFLPDAKHGSIPPCTSLLSVQESKMITYKLSPTTVLLGVLVTLLVTRLIRSILEKARASSILSRYPVVNPRWTATDKERLLKKSHEVILEGLSLVSDQHVLSLFDLLLTRYVQSKGGPFRLRDSSNTKLVLPPKYIEEIKNIPQFSSESFNAKDFFASYPGFDVFRSSNPEAEEIWSRALKKEMAAVWPLAIAPMAKEVSSILGRTFGQADDWKEIGVYGSCITVISRITQLVLLGEEFMNNDEWQRVATEHSVDVFKAAATLHQWPSWLRPVVHWFLPECRRIRAQVKQARAIIGPEVKRRVQYREMLLKNADGNTKERPRRVLDSVDWFVAANPENKPFDYAGTQMSLAMAANQTSSNALSYYLGDLLSHPEYVQPLRDEVTAVLRDTGGKFDKAALHRLVLMDSFMKESMRLHPPAIITMRRHALGDVRLADGTEIPRDTYCFVAPVPMKDPAVFENPDVFDGRRFLRMRQQAQQGGQDGGAKYHLVSTSADCVMFDYGLHACPGRFLAASYLKLIFSHLLLKYDFKLLPGQSEYDMGKPQGFLTRPNKEQKIMYRSRQCLVNFN